MFQILNLYPRDILEIPDHREHSGEKNHIYHINKCINICINAYIHTRNSSKENQKFCYC